MLRPVSRLKLRCQGELKGAFIYLCGCVICKTSNNNIVWLSISYWKISKCPLLDAQFNSTTAHFERLPVPTALKRSAILKFSHGMFFLHGATGASGCQQLWAHLRWSPAARCSWCSGTRSRSSAAWGASRSTGWCAGTRGCAFPLWHSEREGGRRGEYISGNRTWLCVHLFLC